MLVKIVLDRKASPGPRRNSCVAPRDRCPLGRAWHAPAWAANWKSRAAENCNLKRRPDPPPPRTSLTARCYRPRVDNHRDQDTTGDPPALLLWPEALPSPAVQRLRRL